MAEMVVRIGWGGEETVRVREDVVVFPELSVTVKEILYVPFENDLDVGLPELNVPARFQS